MMLRINKNSLASQTSRDYEQKFIIDRHGRGVGHANRALANAPITGQYVMVLDDDDKLTDDRAIEWLKEATAERPDLVIFRVDHGDKLGVLPDDLIWGRRPLKGHIGSCSFISRRDVWEKHIHRFGVDECGDYAYLRSVWFDQPDVVWLDKILASVQRISKGQPA
jgi:hypothetical protein